MRSNQTQNRRVTVITPCHNAEEHIETTIRSVIQNHVFIAGEAELEYIVCDGGSTDRTAKIAEKILSGIVGKTCITEIISEKDNGMYHAITKGIEKASGDIITYINAGDYFSPYAFDVTTDIFTRNSVKWLTGLSVLYNEKYHITGAWLPFRYTNRLIQTGFYNHRQLPFIQQAGTFWSSDLNRFIDVDKLKSFRYAGDFYLWKTFSCYASLFIIETWLAGHMIHRNQLSGDISKYYSEMSSIQEKATLFDHILAYAEKPSWFLPNGIKKLLNRKTLLRFNYGKQQYTLI